MLRFLLFLTLIIATTSSFSSPKKNKSSFQIDNIDIDESLSIAVIEMYKPGINKSLGLWALRDQTITTEQATVISKLYLDNIDKMTRSFNIWHSSWAISNLYRQGNEGVQRELEEAYQKAKIQPNRLTGFRKRIADAHINGDKILRGFIHAGGQGYAYRHLVVPGNKKYIQSLEQYLYRQKKKWNH